MTVQLKGWRACAVGRAALRSPDTVVAGVVYAVFLLVIVLTLLAIIRPSTPCGDPRPATHCLECPRHPGLAVYYRRGVPCTPDGRAVHGTEGCLGVAIHLSDSPTKEARCLRPTAR